MLQSHAVSPLREHCLLEDFSQKKGEGGDVGREVEESVFCVIISGDSNSFLLIQNQLEDYIIKASLIMWSTF